MSASQAVEFQELRSALNGVFIAPGDSEYESARRIHNGMIDRYPAGIARCASLSDVVAAVRFARRHNLPVSVLGGGHGVPGFAVCDGGLMIDLSLMRSVVVTARDRTAVTEGGATWGIFDRETQKAGLATTPGASKEQRV